MGFGPLVIEDRGGISRHLWTSFAPSRNDHATSDGGGGQDGDDQYGQQCRRNVGEPPVVVM